MAVAVGPGHFIGQVMLLDHCVVLVLTSIARQETPFPNVITRKGRGRIRRTYNLETHN